MKKNDLGKQKMFFDRANGLRWERYDKNSADEFSAYNELINLWGTARNIKEYIVGSVSQSLANVLVDFVSSGDDNSEGLFYCIVNDDLVGVVCVVSPSDNDDKTSIEYLIVNPRMQGKGIGTRMIKSIKENAPFFTYDKHNGVFCASVECSNEASSRAFLKNGFTVVKPVHFQNTDDFDVLYDPLNRGCFKKYYFSSRGGLSVNGAKIL